MLSRPICCGTATFFFAVLSLLVHPPAPVHGWQNWSTGWCHDQDGNTSSSTAGGHRCSSEWESDPGPRDGHSMLLHNDTKLVIYGGRTNNVQYEHRPKKFNITFKDGKLVFESYHSVELTDCEGVESDRCSKYPYVDVAVYMNDIWLYDLDCFRFSDYKCEHAGWYLVDAGAAYGGCRMVERAGKVTQECTRPTERYNHAAVRKRACVFACALCGALASRDAEYARKPPPAHTTRSAVSRTGRLHLYLQTLFGDDSMVIYGGFSQFCQDYCDDVWVYDLSRCVRMRENSNPYASNPTNVYQNKSETPGAALNNSLYWHCGKWTLLETNTAAGKRWKSGLVSNHRETMWMFGGARLWHGFAAGNTKENSWSDTSVLPEGG